MMKMPKFKTQSDLYWLSDVKFKLFHELVIFDCDFRTESKRDLIWSLALQKSGHVLPTSNRFRQVFSFQYFTQCAPPSPQKTFL